MKILSMLTSRKNNRKREEAQALAEKRQREQERAAKYRKQFPDFSKGGTILVVDDDDCIRAPLFGAYLSDRLWRWDIKFQVISAGYHPSVAMGVPTHPVWEWIMSEGHGSPSCWGGFDWDNHRSRSLQTAMVEVGASAILYVCMDPATVEVLHQLGVPYTQMYLACAPEGIAKPVINQEDPWDPKSLKSWTNCRKDLYYTAEGLYYGIQGILGEFGRPTGSNESVRGFWWMEEGRFFPSDDDPRDRTLLHTWKWG